MVNGCFFGFYCTCTRPTHHAEMAGNQEMAENPSLPIEAIAQERIEEADKPPSSMIAKHHEVVLDHSSRILIEAHCSNTCLLK